MSRSRNSTYKKYALAVLAGLVFPSVFFFIFSVLGVAELNYGDHVYPLLMVGVVCGVGMAGLVKVTDSRGRIDAFVKEQLWISISIEIFCFVFAGVGVFLEHVSELQRKILIVGGVVAAGALFLRAVKYFKKDTGMSNERVSRVLSKELSKVRGLSYGQLYERVLRDDPDAYEVVEDGITYDIEIMYFWDGGKPGDIRVACAINVSGGWSAYFPRSDDFIMRPDGSLV